MRHATPVTTTAGLRGPHVSAATTDTSPTLQQQQQAQQQQAHHSSYMRPASPGRHRSPFSSRARASSLSGAALAAGSDAVHLGSSSTGVRPASTLVGTTAGSHQALARGAVRTTSSGSDAPAIAGAASAHHKSSNSGSNSSPDNGGFKACLQPRVEREHEPAVVLTATAAACSSRPSSPTAQRVAASRSRSSSRSSSPAAGIRPAITNGKAAASQPPRSLLTQQQQPLQPHSNANSRRQLSAIASPSDESYLQRLQHQRHAAAAAAASSLGARVSSSSSSSSPWPAASSRMQLALQRLMGSSQRCRSASAGLADAAGNAGQPAALLGVARSFSAGPGSDPRSAAEAGGPAAAGSALGSAAGPLRELLGRQQLLLQGGLLDSHQAFAAPAAAAAAGPSPLCAANPLGRLRQKQQQQLGQLVPGIREQLPPQPQPQQLVASRQDVQPICRRSSSGGGSSGGSSAGFFSAGGSSSSSSIRSLTFISLSGSDADGPAAAGTAAGDGAAGLRQSSAGSGESNSTPGGSSWRLDTSRPSAAPAGSRLANASDSTWQEQQQRRASSSSSGSGGGSSGISRSPSFLIGTCAAQDDAADVADISCSSPECAGWLQQQRVDLPALTASAAERQSDDAATALQFLTASFSPRSSSFTAASASAGASTSGTAGKTTAAAAREALLQHQWQREQAVSMAGVTPDACSSSSSSSGDDSVVSELSESLRVSSSDDDDGSSSRSSSSSPRGCSAHGVGGSGAAARLWLGGRRRLGGSSSSIASEGRSSSCDSRRDADTCCGSSLSPSGSGVPGALATQAAGSSSRLGSLRRQPGPPSSSALPAGCVGLANLGNTCFMNSILQCLNCLPEFVTALRGPIQWNSKATIGPALSELLAQMWSAPARSPSSSPAVVTPQRLLRALAAVDERWGAGCQQDSQEFLHGLLELLQGECNKVTTRPAYRELSSQGSEAAQAAEAAAYACSWNNSVIDDLFGGMLQSTVTCGGCGAASHRFDPLLDLSLPLPRAGAAGHSQAVSLQACLSAFTEEELLNGSEAVTCACKATCSASKRLRVFTPPRLLVLTLKRFSSSSSSSFGGGLLGGWVRGGCSPFLSKNTTPVVLEATLDLTPFCNPLGLQAAAAQGLAVARPLYHLVAVSEHSGCMAGGHYTAQGCAAVNSGGGWFAFDDAVCARKERALDGSSSAAAYVLFFRLTAAANKEG